MSSKKAYRISQVAYRIPNKVWRNMAFRFESLEIWQLAIEYGNDVYILADKLPQKELFGLGSQFRRSAVSMSNNIAEGSGGTVRDFKNYLDIAIKSTLEIVSMLIFAQKRGYVDEKTREEFYEKAERLIRKIRAFKKSLKEHNEF